jgi:hypothetical protein
MLIYVYFSEVVIFVVFRHVRISENIFYNTSWAIQAVAFHTKSIDRAKYLYKYFFIDLLLPVNTNVSNESIGLIMSIWHVRDLVYLRLLLWK